MKIVLIANTYFNIFNFRNDLILELNKKYPSSKIYILAQTDGFEKKIKLFKNLTIINIPLIPRSINFISNIKTSFLIFFYLIKIRPSLVISYTIKPNFICLILKKLLFYKLITNITGFGELYLSQNKILKIFFYIFLKLLHLGNVIIVQNVFDRNYLIEKSKKISKKIKLIPGSGVNNKFFKYTKINYKNKIFITFIGRIIKEKGILELLHAVIKFKRLHPKDKKLEFIIIGQKYNDHKFNFEFDRLLKISKIKYINHTDYIYNFIRNSHFIILPSYREGLSKVLIESISSGRPIITSNVPGCKDLLMNNINGFLINISSDSILKVFNKIIKLNKENLSFLSKNSYKTSRKYSNSIIIEDYSKIIDSLLNEK